MEKQSSIEKPILVAVEGKDDARFLKYLCKKWGFYNIQFRYIGCQPNDSNISAITKEPGFIDKVNCFVIIRDADTDFFSAEESTKEIFLKLGLAIKTASFIFPDNKSNGMLETLLTRVVEQNEPDKNECINRFINCLMAKGINIPSKEIDKAKIYAYLSANEEPGKRIGDAAEQLNLWDTESDVLKPVKNFFEKLCDEISHKKYE
ncbi:hypothetical protein OMAG_000316 [Candidatus Omnitrophus magneticus]|uniref:DUF4435 domain-containing protein n=1 Tax=Candidatus Omnitrophus magneticus TaxID=1609969 RepID=A0A0F0CR65_9BACT|nr:hypothetical protein OMAG_000316 [Candidatus Omnitrophus magneticus]